MPYIMDDHTHEDGKICVRIGQTHRRDHPLTDTGIFDVGGQRLYGGLMPWTGQWYFYQPSTGREIMQINNRFGRSLVDGCRIGTFVEDPDCVLEAS